jgi:hypothetical protein
MLLLKLKIDIFQNINNNYLIITMVEKDAIFYQTDLDFKSFYDEKTKMYIYPVTNISVSHLIKTEYKKFYIPKSNNIKLLYRFDIDRQRKIFLKILYNTLINWMNSYNLHEYNNINMKINNKFWIISCDD